MLKIAAIRHLKFV